jgi:hypothetical protein
LIYIGKEIGRLGEREREKEKDREIK